MYEGTRDKNKFISLLTKVTEGRRISAEIFAANRHSTTVNDTHIEQFKLRNDALALLGAQTVQVSPQIGTKGMLSVLDARMSANALELRRLRDAPAAALASPAPAAASRAEAVRAEAELDEKMIQSLTERINMGYTGEDMDGIVYDIRTKYTIERENGVAPPRAGFLTLTYIQNTYLGKKGGKTKRSRKSRKGARKSRKGARKSRKHLFYKI
jgi:hypothetical protein